MNCMSGVEMPKSRLSDSYCFFVKSSQLIGNVSFYYRARQTQEIREKDREGVLSFLCSDGIYRTFEFVNNYLRVLLMLAQ